MRHLREVVLPFFMEQEIVEELEMKGFRKINLFSSPEIEKIEEDAGFDKTVVIIDELRQVYDKFRIKSNEELINVSDK